MSLPEKTQLFYSKTDRKTLIKYLEKYYVIELNRFNKHFDSLSQDGTKSQIEKFERKYRLKLKSIEILLHSLGSEFMSDVQNINYRKTTEINAQRNGLLHGKGSRSDHSDS